MLKRPLLLIALALSLGGSAWASFPKAKLEEAIRQGYGLGTEVGPDWLLVSTQCDLDPRDPEKVIHAVLVFRDHAAEPVGDLFNPPHYRWRTIEVLFDVEGAPGTLIRDEITD